MDNIKAKEVKGILVRFGLAILVICAVFLTACSEDTSSVSTDNDQNSDQGGELPEGAETFGNIAVMLPDETWSGEKDGFECVLLFKEGHCYNGDPTIKIFIDDYGLEESQENAGILFPALAGSDFELQVGPYTCVGNRTEMGIKNIAVIDRVFYPINENQTLRFQVFTENGPVTGLEKEDPEVLSIIQSVIELNHFGEDAVPINERSDEDGVVASGQDQETTWTLYSDGSLHIGGSDSMTSHGNSDDYQWARYSNDVTEIQFDVDIKSISSLAFKNFRNLKKVDLPSSVKNLYIGCFEGCTALKEIALPERLQETDYYVFAGCTSLQEVTVPGSLKHVSNYAFDSCTSLRTARISSGVESFGYDVFSNCTVLQTVYLPKSIKKIDSYSFYRTGLEEVYYEGNENDFREIEIMDHNDDLQDADIHYESVW